MVTKPTKINVFVGLLDVRGNLIIQNPEKVDAEIFTEDVFDFGGWNLPGGKVEGELKYILNFRFLQLSSQKIL